MDGDPAREREAIVARLALRTSASGTLSGPCIPALVDHYFDKVLKLLEAIDRPPTGDRRAQFQAAFRQAIDYGFRLSPYSRFVLTYGPSGESGADISCDLSLTSPPLDEQYQRWLGGGSAGNQPFGSHADAKVVDLASRLENRGDARILDVGAGTGRNALALARLGLAVEAIEPVPALADALMTAAAAEGLAVHLIQKDALSPDTQLEPGRYRLIVLSEVVTHFSEAQLALMLAKLARSLTADGSLLLNAFISKDGYRPSPVSEQVAQVVWSTFFSRQQLAALAERIGLHLVSEEPCIGYEQARQPAAAWPPTPWYVAWASGHNLFDESGGPTPIELRWLEYRLRP